MSSVITHQVTVAQTGHVMWRQTETINMNGRMVEFHHRTTLEPGDALDGVPEEVATIARAAWTDAVVSRFQAALQAAIALRARVTAQP